MIPPPLALALEGRYRIERELGAGGMATVYLAQDLKHDRKVALKVLRPELAAVIGAERFLSEIKTTANLQHPHILPLFDSGEAGGLLFYVMPYVEGETVRDRLTREKQLPISDALRIATEVASALDYAHRRGVIHRDIKPENILLHDGSALVADFGIALAVSSAGGTRMTETGMSLGTPHYMSPEQAMGEREITARSDVYALACVLYEMLTGDPPFTGSTAQAIVARVLTEAPRGMKAQRHTIPPHVEAAVTRALEKLPADRFSSAAEFADALARPELMAATTADRAAAPGAARASRATIIGLAAALVLTTGAAAWGWLSYRRAADQPASWQYVSLGDSAALNPAINAVGFALSPDGNTLVFRNERANGQLWIKRRSALAATPIPGTDQSWDPAFSPDGRAVAFVQDNKLKRVDLSGGAPVTLADTAAGGYGGVAWLDDGTLVYVLPGQTAFRRVSASGGPSTTVWRDTSNMGGGSGIPQPLPGARGVLFQYCGSGCVTVSIHVLDLKTGVARPLLDNVEGAWYLPSGYLLYVRPDGAGLAAPFDLKTLKIIGAAVPVLDHVFVQTANGVTPLAWSRSGTLVYVPGTGSATKVQIMRVTREGVATPVDSAWAGELNSLALSPDGRRLAVGDGGGAGNFNIWLKQMDRGPYSRLSFGDRDRRPAWSPDGRTVAFVRDTGANGGVYGRPADGTGSDRVLVQIDRRVQEVTWSPDGKWLVLRTDNTAPGAGDLVGVRTSGDTTPVPLVATRFSELSPAVSPDGKWLAYSSDDNGTPEVYVRPFPNTNGGRWQVSLDGGIDPAWSRDGRSLFFIDDNKALVEARLGAGPSFSVAGRQPLFQTSRFSLNMYHQDYVAEPGGKSFLFLESQQLTGQRDAAEVVWVDHWFTDLEKKLKR
ncbi:MAG TPA: protein kinase [Gemmatimonadaceae bacterium]|nr:protein kinase [Gemmatimonadaceae bacterium]